MLPKGHVNVGEYALLKGRPTPAICIAISQVVIRQLELRGDASPFTFKAFGCKWKYTPMRAE